MLKEPGWKPEKKSTVGNTEATLIIPVVTCEQALLGVGPIPVVLVIFHLLIPKTQMFLPVRLNVKVFM